MQEFLKSNAADLIVKGFFPLLMVAAVLWGAYEIVNRQLSHVEATQKEMLGGIVEKLQKVDNNLDKLRRDVLRANNPNATEPQ